MTAPAPYILHPPQAQAGGAHGLLISSPHSGSDYPPSFLAASQLNKQDIRRSEDMYVDEIFSNATRAGATMLAATYPRAYLDLNRAGDEWDTQLFEDARPHKSKNPKANDSVYTKAGLGVIPRLIAPEMPIYNGTITHAEADQRMQNIYHPFHAKLGACIAELHTKHGQVVLLDVHSMPSQAAEGIDIAIGNRQGASAAPALNQWLATYFTNYGLRVGINHPYAGGYIVGRYGAPQNNIHAIQIEINRPLYMNELTLAKTENFAALQNKMSEMLTALTKTLPQFRQVRHADETMRIAAE